MTCGTPKTWSTRLLTPSEALHKYAACPEAWDVATVWGRRAYETINGAGVATWVAAFFVIAEAVGTERAEAFFEEVTSGTGAPGAATRKLWAHYRNRKVGDTASGDRREPLENVIRAYNAWTSNKPVGFVRVAGAFVLSMPKS